MIKRSMVAPLIPEDVQKEIVDSLPEYSTVMKLGKKAQNMSRKQRRIPCVSVLPTAYFSNPGPSNKDESEQWKKKTRMQWENKYLDAEEIHGLVIIPEAVFDDADYDIWAQVKPKILEAIGLAFDQAVFYGVNAPAVWPSAIVTASIAAGNWVTLGSVTDPNNSTNDIYDDIMGMDGVIGKVEADGYMVNGHISDMTMRGRLRGLRDENKQPIFKALYKEGVQGNTMYSLDGAPMYFPRNGAVDPTRSLLIAGDWDQLMYAIRKDVTWKILDQAVIQDPTTGEILYNLPQQDSIALRCDMRLAWQVPNPINRLNDDEDTRYPFSVLLPAGS
jgi:HK97 family phage major capsid protein